MPIAPQPAWSAAYEPGVKAYYAQYQLDQTYLALNFWQQWLDPHVIGIQSAAPFVGSTGITTPTAFAPLPLEAAKSAPAVAAIFATAWTNYMLAITWPVIPPIPPFSAITSIVSSPTGVAASAALLLAGLTAELALLPPDPLTAFQAKADAFANLFQTATATAGIMITGLGIGVPPPPLIVPLSPVL